VRAVKVTLSGDELAALRRRLRVARRLLPGGARLTEGVYIASILRADLAKDLAAQRKLGSELLARFWPVARAVAARWFRQLRGEVPLAELDSAAFNEIATAAQRFDPSLGYSPAPYFRRWAEWGVRALMRQRAAEAQLVHPDGDADQGEASRWERIGEVDTSLETAPERAELRAAAAAWLRQQSPAARRAVQLLAEGQGDDQVAEATGLDLAELELLRAGLAEATGIQRDEELTPAQAAQVAGVPPKVVYKAVAGGALAARRRAGAWVLRASDVRAWARRRAR